LLASAHVCMYVCMCINIKPLTHTHIHICNFLHSKLPRWHSCMYVTFSAHHDQMVHRFFLKYQGGTHVCMYVCMHVCMIVPTFSAHHDQMVHHFFFKYQGGTHVCMYVCMYACMYVWSFLPSPHTMIKWCITSFSNSCAAALLGLLCDLSLLPFGRPEPDRRLSPVYVCMCVCVLWLAWGRSKFILCVYVCMKIQRHNNRHYNTCNPQKSITCRNN
jgi:hypothetical protein